MSDFDERDRNIWCLTMSLGERNKKARNVTLKRRSKYVSTFYDDGIVMVVVLVVVLYYIFPRSQFMTSNIEF